MLSFRATFKNFKFLIKTFPNKSLPILPNLSKSFVVVKWYSDKVDRFHKSVISNYLNSRSRSRSRRLEQARDSFERSPSVNIGLCTKMIVGCAKNGRLNDALELFEKMLVRDVICWNSMIKGCLDCGDVAMAMRMFDEMPKKNVVSYTTMVTGYMQFGRVEAAERLFWDMPERDAAAWNAMIHGYCMNGRVKVGFKFFEEMPCRDVISWTSMIAGLDHCGKSEEALLLFGKMVHSGADPTAHTFTCVLAACASAKVFLVGIQVHCLVIKLGHDLDEFVLASLLTFYANCKEVESARKTFCDSFSRNVVLWTALVTGYGLNSKHEDALKVFADMINMGVLPNQSTLTSALKSCCGLEAFDEGKIIHSLSIKVGLETDTFVGNSLIILYFSSGSMNDAVFVFRKIHNKNVVSWNSIINGSAQHGHGMWSLIFFSQMIRAGVDPDEITFTELLSACSHSGMLRKGRCVFKYICHYKSTLLNLRHYACMVDILGRFGELEEAEELIRNMPMEANSKIWLALLSACTVHSNLEVGERAAKCIFDLDPYSSAPYTLLSNLYTSAGRWSDASTIRLMMKKKGVAKQLGSSWVVLEATKNEFLSVDKSHPLTEKIQEKLDCLKGS